MTNDAGAGRGNATRMLTTCRQAATVALWAALLGTLCSCIGPRTSEGRACAYCGKGWTQKTRLGIRYTDRPFDTDLSRRYAANSLKPHEHCWQFVCSESRGWTGRGLFSDGFGFFLLPLWSLRDVQPYVDESTFRSLCEEYYASVGMDGDESETPAARFRRINDRSKAFAAKCQAIIAANQPDAGGGR